MKKMTRWTLGGALAASLVLVMAGTPAHAQSADRDVCASAVYRFPGAGDFDVYDDAYGLQFQCRHWTVPTLGWGLSAGWETWSANGDGFDWGGKVRGDAQVAPVGASGLWRPLGDESGGPVFEAGIRYAFVFSDLTLGEGEARRSVDVDPGLVGLLALRWVTPVSDQTAWFAGVGYQFDLLPGEATAGPADLRDNQLQSFYIEAGLCLRF